MLADQKFTVVSNLCEKVDKMFWNLFKKSSMFSVVVLLLVEMVDNELGLCGNWIS